MVLRRTSLLKERIRTTLKDFGIALFLYKINCRTHQFALLEISFYSFEKTVLFSNSSQYEEWSKISPGSIIEDIEKYVCKERGSY
ncbi:surface-adhesin E family protein [Thermocrinis albus]|uniref:surface-adhesin E family protein n=1 Tax=Thermocrinis albus TaxID=136094 RepID=UPI003CE5B6A0